MNKTLHVKKGDTVKIIAGNEKPRKVKGEKVVKTGTVTSVDNDSSTVVVENVNMGYKHKKAKNAKDTGGRVQLAMPVHSSNVMVVCPECNSPTRVNYKVTEGEDGKKLKVRVCKKCGAAMDKKVESVKAKKDKKEREKAEKKAKKEKDKKEKAEKAEKKAKKATEGDNE